MTRNGATRRAPCPDCGAEVTFTFDDYLGREYHWCDPCVRRSMRMREARRAELRVRFPALSPRVINALDRHFPDGGTAAILAATDTELLGVRNFGRGMLAEFRAVWPEPAADVATSDPWRDHAEMVAGVR